MRTPSTTALSVCLIGVTLIGCSKRSSGDTDSLVITSRDSTAIAARYTENGHTLVLASKVDGGKVKSEILDDDGRSMTQLASAAAEARARTAQGDLTVPIATLTHNADQLGATLEVANHGLEHLHDALSSDAADSEAFHALSHEVAVVRRGFVTTKLALLQAWQNEVRRQITMTDDEHSKFFALFNREAQTITAAAKHGHASTTSTLDADLAALLGPERFNRYTSERTLWLASAGDHTSPVTP